MKLKDYLKEEGVPVNATGPAVAGTNADVTWVKKKKKYKDVLTRMGITTNGCSCPK